MSLEYVRRTYSVPAKRGGRVQYTGGPYPKLGTIVGAKGPHLSIRLDGEDRPGRYHPTWELRYLDTSEPAKP